jgi:hypothetical protein
MTIETFCNLIAVTHFPSRKPSLPAGTPVRFSPHRDLILFNKQKNQPKTKLTSRVNFIGLDKHYA